MIEKNNELLIDNNICKLQCDLLTAIKEYNSQEVLVLLKKGASPNFTDEQHPTPLIVALSHLDPKQSESSNIIKLLLEQGADYLSEQGITESWTNAFDFCLDNNIDYTFINILIAHSIRQNTISEFSIASLSANCESKMVALLLENGFYYGLNDAVRGSLEEFCVSYKNDARFNGFNNLKCMYYAAIKSNSLELEQEELRIFLQIAIEESDFEFAWYLIATKEANINLITPYIVKHEFESPLIVLLLARKEHHNQFHSSILTLLLNNNYALTTANINKIQTYQHDEKNSNSSAAFNVHSIKFAKLIDTKLYSAMITFLHPFQITLHPKLSLNIRLKLAIYYLRTELEEIIKLVSDFQLKKILLDRSAHYLIEYPDLVTTSLTAAIFSYDKENNNNQLAMQVKKLLDHHFNDSSFVFPKPKMRSMLVKYLQSIDIGQYTISNSLAAYSSLINLWTKDFKEDQPLTISIKFFTLYLFGYAVEKQLEKTFSKLMLNPEIKALTNNYKELKRLINYLQSDQYPFKNFIFINFNIKWLKERLMIFAIKIKSLENVLVLKKNFYPEIGTIKLAANTNQNKIVETLISDFMELPDYHDLILIAIKNKNSQLAEFLINSLILQNHKRVLNSTKCPEVISSIFTHILIYKQFFLLDSLAILASDLSLQQTFVYLIFENLQIFPQDIASKLASFFLDNKSQLAFKDIFKTKPFHGKDQKSFSILKKLLHIKQSNTDMLKFLASSGFNNSGVSNLSSLANQNYRNLINRLIDPSHLMPGYYSAILKEKDYNILLATPNILTKREAKLYKNLISMKWKAAHGVRNSADLLKIQASKSIKSVQLRENLGEEVTNSSTLPIYRLKRMIFITLGPQKAPTPFFLKNSPYIEFDVDKLLTSHPDFFKYACLSSHWHSYYTQQEFQPIKYKNTVIHTKHANNVQYNYAFQPNQKPTRLLHKISDNLFFGPRVIHILCLLFIDRLRLEYGEAYEEILDNADNLDLISEKFLTIMHPGLFEIRLPHSIDLDDAFCDVKYPPAIKILKEEELLNAAKDVNILQKYIQEGFDCYQPSIMQIEQNGKIHSYMVTFFARAILNRSQPVIDLLFSIEHTQLESQDQKYLTALSAAIMMKDHQTAIRLLINGIPLRKDINAYQIPIDSPKISEFFNSLTIVSFSQLADHTHAEKILYSLFQACIEYIPANFHEETLLLNTIKKLETITHFYVTQKNPALLQAIHQNRNDFLTLLLLKNVHFNFSVVKHCLISKNDALLTSIIALNKVREVVRGIDLLWLFISGKYQIFISFFNQLHENVKGNIDDISSKLVINLYTYHQKELLKFILTKKYENKCFVNKIFLDKLFKIIFDVNKCYQFIKEFNDVELVIILVRNLNLSTNLTDIAKFILKHDFIHQEKLVTHLPKLYKDINRTEIIDYFNFLQIKPEYFIQALFINDLENIFSYLDLNFVLKLFLGNFNAVVTNNLYSLFLTTNNLCAFLDKVAQKEIEPNMVANWLIRIINHEISLIFLFIPQNKKLLKSTLINILPEIRNAPDLKNYANTYQARLQSFLHYLFEDQKENVNFATENLWSMRHQLQATTTENEVGIQFWKKFQLPNDPKAPIRHAVAAFITCSIGGEQHVFLGRKIIFSSKSKYLLAPGGFIKDTVYNEGIISGAIREIKEETNFLIRVPQNFNPDEKISESGEISFIENESTTSNMPSKISLLHTYIGCDDFNKAEVMQQRFTYFLWFNYDNDISNAFASNDDFADGIWVPLSKIEKTKNGLYQYLDQPILQSNGMLIDHLLNSYVSRSLLSETIYKECFDRNNEVKFQREQLHQNKEKSLLSSKFFQSVLKNPGKRKPIELVENNNRKIPKQ